MTDDHGRRSFLAGLASITGSSTILTTAVSANSTGDTIDERMATTIAERKVEQLAARPDFDDWEVEGVGRPELFYAPVQTGSSSFVSGILGEHIGLEYEPSAYVFPVRRGGRDVGFVTIAAQETLEPVLGFSQDTPPQRRVSEARRAAREEGLVVTGRLLYQGGVSYGLEARDGTVIDLRTELSGDLPTLPGFHALELSGANDRRWEAHRQRANPLTIQTADASRADDHVEDVPDWVEEDPGNEDVEYPENLGNTADPWDDWDGCSPVSSSLILGFHEDVDPDDQDAIDRLIDVLHVTMGTDDETGGTSFRGISRGITAYDRGEFDYRARNYWRGRRQRTKEQVGGDQPPLLSMIDGSRDTDGRYGNHSVAIVGYSEEGEDDDEFYYMLHTGWGGLGPEWIAHGNWERAALTTVDVSEPNDSDDGWWW